MSDVSGAFFFDVIGVHDNMSQVPVAIAVAVSEGVVVVVDVSR